MKKSNVVVHKATSRSGFIFYGVVLTEDELFKYYRSALTCFENIHWCFENIHWAWWADTIEQAIEYYTHKDATLSRLNKTPTYLLDPVSLVKVHPVEPVPEVASKEPPGGSLKSLEETTHWLASGVDEVSRDIEALRHDMCEQYAQMDELRRLAAQRNAALSDEVTSLREALQEVTQETLTLGRKLTVLDRKKIDRPSFSGELASAERYMDDMIELGRKEREKAFSTRQRLKEKLSVVEDVGQKQTTPTRLGWLALFAVGVIPLLLATPWIVENITALLT